MLDSGKNFISDKLCWTTIDSSQLWQVDMSDNKRFVTCVATRYVEQQLIASYVWKQNTLNVHMLA